MGESSWLPEMFLKGLALPRQGRWDPAVFQGGGRHLAVLDQLYGEAHVPGICHVEPTAGGTRTCTCAEAGTRLTEGHQLACGRPSDGTQTHACEHTHGRVRLGILASRSIHLARPRKSTLQRPPRGAQPPAPFAISPHKGTRAALKISQSLP